MDIYTVLGVFFAPLLAALLFGVLGAGIRLAIAKYLPESWIKRQLLKERIKTRYSAANARIEEHSRVKRITG
jgi:hypothetical protein